MVVTTGDGYVASAEPQLREKLENYTHLLLKLYILHLHKRKIMQRFDSERFQNG
jgi:hypothetical protein